MAGGRERCGAERRRVSCGGGPGAQPPENFEVFALHIPPTSTFRNRAQISDQFFDDIKICIFLIKHSFMFENRCFFVPGEAISAKKLLNY